MWLGCGSVCQAATMGASMGSPAARTVRVSMSMLLRVRDDARFVLFHMPSRPGSFGPPGGVCKYFPPATGLLDELGFQQERSSREPDPTAADLRGFLPATRLRHFLRWYDSGAYRENAIECLARELAEEFDEVGLPHLGNGFDGAPFVHLHTVDEGPDEVPGKAYRQYRRFDVYDLVAANGAALWLLQELVSAGADPDVPLVMCATRQSVLDGRHKTALIAPHSAFLLSRGRIMQDIPPLR